MLESSEVATVPILLEGKLLRLLELLELVLSLLLSLLLLLLLPLLPFVVIVADVVVVNIAVDAKILIAKVDAVELGVVVVGGGGEKVDSLQTSVGTPENKIKSEEQDMSIYSRARASE